MFIRAAEGVSNLMSRDVTVILNGYKRQEYLQEQLTAVWSQTVTPKQVMMWNNNPQGSHLIDESITPPKQACITAYCNTNLGVWARFAYALMAETTWVCILDDDTIPGERWLENCLDTQVRYPGLHVTRGLIFKNKHDYHQYDGHVGWGYGNKEATRVDMGGHAWFFRRDWLSHFWREIPDPRYPVVGEDLHFSAMLQRYGGLNTYVPPHPPGDQSLWGSIRGADYGNDSNAMCVTVPRIGGRTFFDLMNDCYKYEISKGWKIING